MNDYPIVVAATYNVDEDAGVGTPIGTVVASDQDSGVRGVLTYAITDGNELGLFQIDPNTALLTTVSATLNFEVT